MKLIDKSALVAEIDKITKALYRQNPDEFGDETQFLAAAEIGTLNLVKDIIDTLEVKEADFEKELDKEWNKCEPIDEGMGLEIASIEHEQFDNIAKHFFELGLNARKENEL